MTDTDRPAFARALAELSAIFRQPFTSEQAELYFRALDDLPLHRVLRAVQHAIRTYRRFPRPADLRAADLERRHAAERPKVTKQLALPEPAVASAEHARDAFAVIREILAGECRGELRVAALDGLVERYPDSGWSEAADVEHLRVTAVPAAKGRGGA